MAADLHPNTIQVHHVMVSTVMTATWLTLLSPLLHVKKKRSGIILRWILGERRSDEFFYNTLLENAAKYTTDAKLLQHRGNWAGHVSKGPLIRQASDRQVRQCGFFHTLQDQFKIYLKRVLGSQQ